MGGIVDLIEAVKHDIRICAAKAIANNEIARNAKINSEFVQEKSATIDGRSSAKGIGGGAAENQFAVVFFDEASWSGDGSAKIQNGIGIDSDTGGAIKEDIAAPKIARARPKQGGGIRGGRVQGKRLGSYGNAAEHED